MSINDRCGDRHVHYVGTDPNQDNWLRDDYSRYEYLAEFIHKNRPASLFPHNHSYHLFSCGSEDIGNHPDFQQYKGKIDLVFTSPPYFGIEQYSDDDTQSYKKFPDYDLWRDGFLRPTLENAVASLKNNRYLIWNIADMNIGKKYLPLQKDSIEILESLGMIRQDDMLLKLMNMPGANRTDENGVPTCKNFCKLNGKYNKVEPILVFYKP